MTGMLAPVRRQHRAAPRAPSRPFSLVDELSCYFDSAAEPNNVHVEVRLPGHLDVARLRAAVTAALASQPRARARRAATGPWRRGYNWQFPESADDDPVQVTSWRTETELAQVRARFLAAAPKLDRSPPFRLLLASAPDQDTLILNAHHAAFDGHSCLRLLQSVAAAYSAPSAPRPGSHPSPQAFTPNERPPQLPPGRRTPLPRPSARIEARRADDGRPGGGRPHRTTPGYGFVLLSCPGVPVAPQPAAGPRVTVNDLLVAALIVTIASWNRSHRGRRGRRLRPIRISVPADARTPCHHDDLGNLSRLCTITAGPPHAASPPRASDPPHAADLLADIAAQTSAAKQRPGPQVGPALTAVAKLPVPAGARRRVLRLAMRCLGGLASDTSLLSNLGNVTDPPTFAGLVPERMWFSTSAHMPRGLAVGAITSNGELQLCFRYRRALFDDAAARDFVASYRTALGALAAR